MADRRFPTSFKDVPDANDPGLVLGDDNVVYLIEPDGSRVAVGSGGGFAPIGVVLSADVSGIDLATASGFRPQFALPWSTLYDNSVDFNQILAMPDGIGMTLALGSSDLTTTTAGVWWVGCAVNLPEDATLGGIIGPRGIGVLDQQFGPGVHSPDPSHVNAADGLCQCGELIYIPSGTTFHYFIEVDALPTASPYFLDQAIATILRIA